MCRAGLSWELLQLHVVSAEVTLLVAFGREMAGAETPTMTSLSGVSAGVAETAGEPNWASRSSWLSSLSHDDFIQSFICCLDA